MKYSKDTLERWLTSSQKKVVNLALEKMKKAYSEEAKTNPDIYKVWINLYNEDVFILGMFNEFVNWDKFCKYCFDNGISFSQE